MLSFQCSYCGADLEIPQYLLGKSAECNACHKMNFLFACPMCRTPMNVPEEAKEEIIECPACHEGVTYSSAPRQRIPRSDFNWAPWVGGIICYILFQVFYVGSCSCSSSSNDSELRTVAEKRMKRDHVEERGRYANGLTYRSKIFATRKHRGETYAIVGVEALWNGKFNDLVIYEVCKIGSSDARVQSWFEPSGCLDDVTPDMIEQIKAMCEW